MTDAIPHLRELAGKVAEAANSPRMAQIRRLWGRHNALQRVERPPVVAHVEAPLEEFVPDLELLCADPLLAPIERRLTLDLLKLEIGDDWVIEPWVDVPAVHLGEDRPTMWGVSIDTRSPEGRGAFTFKPQIREEADIDKLRVPDWRVDEAATALRYEQVAEALDGILDVQIVYGRLGGRWWGPWLGYWGAYLRGLEQMMYDCVERPEWMRRFMGFLGDAHLQHLRGLEAQGHVNRNDCGYRWHCDDLPQADSDGGPVRLRDTWCYADSQEFTGVSPAMHEEFLLQYQMPLTELAGLTLYGCCERLDGKIGMLTRNISNLRRVVISPWTDLEYAARECGDQYVIEWRPNQTEIVHNWDREQMRADLERGMRVLDGCLFDIQLVGAETWAGRPEKIATWTQEALEVGASFYGA